jgi:hypothetical protein
MLTEREERLRNERVRKMLFNIPDARQMVAARQMSLMGKSVRHQNPPDRREESSSRIDDC